MLGVGERAVTRQGPATRASCTEAAVGRLDPPALPAPPASTPSGLAHGALSPIRGPHAHPAAARPQPRRPRRLIRSRGPACRAPGPLRYRRTDALATPGLARAARDRVRDALAGAEGRPRDDRLGRALT